MPFSPEEIENKEFIVGLRGYSTTEVRAFLRAVAVDYDAALKRAPPPPVRPPGVSQTGAVKPATAKLAPELQALLHHLQDVDEKTRRLESLERALETTLGRLESLLRQAHDGRSLAGER